MDIKGADIIRVRKELNLSREQFSIVMGVTNNTVARWERDEVVPTLDATRKIEQLLLAIDDKEGHVCLTSLLSAGGVGALCATLSAVGAALPAVSLAASSTSSLILGAIAPPMLVLPAAYGLYKALAAVFEKDKDIKGGEQPLKSSKDEK